MSTISGSTVVEPCEPPSAKLPLEVILSDLQISLPTARPAQPFIFLRSENEYQIILEPTNWVINNEDCTC